MLTQQVNISTYSNPLIRFVSDRKFRWLRHILFILLGLLLAFNGDLGVGQSYSSKEAYHTILKVDIITFAFIVAMVYLLILVLIPKLLFRGKMLWYLLSVFTIVFLIFVLVWALDVYLIIPANIPNLFHVEWTVLSILQIGAVTSVLLGAVTGLMVFKKWINDSQRISELDRRNLKTELEQLKSQVNPHFLFNTLNNLMVLMQTDVKKASQVLIGLSDLLRYQLYDTTKERILLNKDIDFMRNLLDLEKIRKTNFSYEIEIVGNPNGLRLPPFLFIPFVENAIKHGASTVEQSYLQLNFEIGSDRLLFTARNSKPSIANSQIGGLGLANIRRRLELLYPQTHQLNISDNKDEYCVTLSIPV